MTCIEFLDGQKTLQHETTSQLLGVHFNAAKLINVMRHKITHAPLGGGCELAFKEAVRDKFKGQVPQLPSPWCDYIQTVGGEPKLDFMRFFLQVCERVDAAICARWADGPRYAPLVSVLELACCNAPEMPPKKQKDVQREIDSLYGQRDKWKRTAQGFRLDLGQCKKEIAQLKREIQTLQSNASHGN